MASIPDISVRSTTPAQTRTSVAKRVENRLETRSPGEAPNAANRKREPAPCPNIAPPIFYDRQRCPTRNTLAPLLNVWTFLVLTHLSFGQHRYTELRGAIPDISDRMLTKTLKTLVETGLVNKDRQAGMPPRVDYDLTPLGQSLLPAMEPLMHWALRNPVESLRQ